MWAIYDTIWSINSLINQKNGKIMDTEVENLIEENTLVSKFVFEVMTRFFVHVNFESGAIIVLPFSLRKNTSAVLTAYYLNSETD